MIKMHGICKTYHVGKVGIPALRNVSLHVCSGEIIAIMGPSGSGKSTLMNIIGCLDTADTGIYKLGGRHIETVSEDELAAIRIRQFGFVFQFFNLIARLNVYRNVELPMVYARTPPKVRCHRVYDVLERVGLRHRAGHHPAQLSGGEQQRVAIARALVNDPKIIIADEPTGNLDSMTSREIMKIFSQLSSEGKTVIVVTHHNEIATYAERIVRLCDGTIENNEVVQ